MNKYKFNSADILLPKKGFEKWAVVACDQFTSERDYWKEVEKDVGDAPSALRVTLPEIYLEEAEKRIPQINDTMKKYLESNVLTEYKNSMIYVERETKDGLRKGIVGLIDLEEYEYKCASSALIRATEQTVIERIPPRVKIRKDAEMELPHVMLLVDDPEFKVIEPMSGKKENMKSAYDFDLMQNGGHINGWFIDSAEQKRIGETLNSMLDKKEDKLLFAVGDGNHSLATAKECYKLNKNERSRYALVEVVNIHDSSLIFEPIYRVLFGVNAEELKSEMLNKFGGEYNGEDAQKFTYLHNGKEEAISIKPTAKLPVGTLQPFLDEYMKEHSEVKIDYIHGEDVVKNLCKAESTIGFIFEGMKKNELFSAISSDGSLPRKTFSMGHASDKRYYIEARKIK